MKTKLLLLTLTISNLLFSQCNVFVQIDYTGCLDNCQGSAYVSESYGTAPFTYMWSNEQTSTTATDLCADSTYSVIMTDYTGCVDTTFITMWHILTVNIINITSETCLNCCDGSIEFSPLVHTGAPYYFYILNPEVTNAHNGFLDNLCAGTYQACIVDLFGCVKCTDFNVGTYTTTNEINLSTIKSIYHNPANNIIEIQTSEKEYEVELINISGKVIMKQKNVEVLNIENITPGTYIVKLTGQNNTEQQKITIY